jgi:hypothetical protein
MPVKQDRTDRIIRIVLCLSTLAFALSSTYNPLNFRRMHVDSSIYITIARGISRGLLPYRDFVDNKGPLEYLLSVPGLALGGFTGVWITELILIGIAVLFAYKTALLFGGRRRALTGTLCTLAAALAFFTVAAGTEEYSLPFLMVSLYIFTGICLSPERNRSIVEPVVLGACFACAVLIRLNTFPLWLGFCLVIFVEFLARRRFAALGKLAAGFFTGIAVVSVPVFLYLHLNGILDDFFIQVIRGGASKGFGSGIKEAAKNFFIVISRSYSFVPLFLGAFLLITRYKQRDFTLYAGYTLSYFLMLLFLSFSSGDSHYNMILVPFFVPAFTILARALYSALAGLKRRRIALGFLLCLVFSEGILKWLDDFMEIFTNDSGTQLINAGRTIDEHTGPEDTIISLGFNGYIYPFTRRAAASKYIYQGSGIDYLPGSREEFLSDVLEGKPVIGKPAIIAIFTAENGRSDYLPSWYAPVYALIAEEYRLLSEDNGYTLYIRNDRRTDSP